MLKIPTLRVEITSQKTELTEINSRIYIMHKGRGTSLIIMIKRGWGSQERKNNLQYVACTVEISTNSNSRLGGKEDNTVRACRIISRCVQLQPFQLQAT